VHLQVGDPIALEEPVDQRLELGARRYVGIDDAMLAIVRTHGQQATPLLLGHLVQCGACLLRLASKKIGPDAA
jgi:hypothetical protein